jgi:hypothetical protein
VEWQSCGLKASIQARFLWRRISMPLMQHRKETKVGESGERRRFPNFGSAVES